MPSLKIKPTKRVGVCIIVGYAHSPITWPWLLSIATSTHFRALSATRALTIGGHFMGHLAKPAFDCNWIKFSNRCHILLLPTAMTPKELLIEKDCGRPMRRTVVGRCSSTCYWEGLWSADEEDCGRPMLYELACKNIQQYQCSNKQLIACPRRGRAATVRGFPQQLNTYLTSLVFSFTETTLFGHNVWPAH